MKEVIDRVPKQKHPGGDTENFRWKSDADDSAVSFTSPGFKIIFFYEFSFMQPTFLHVLKEIENNHISTHSIQFTDFSM